MLEDGGVELLEFSKDSPPIQNLLGNRAFVPGADMEVGLCHVKPQGS